MNEKDQCYHKAVQILEHCVQPIGFHASGLPGGYQALWARDSMIATLGAVFIQDSFKQTIKKSFITLAQNQSKLGQIPNCVGDFNFDRQSKITFNTIDSNLWYLVGHKIYEKKFNDRSLAKKYASSIHRALLWLAYQDPNEDLLLAQQPTMDWQDAFPHKYGHTIYALALYYAVLKLYGKKSLALRIQKIINGNYYHSLYNAQKGYYYPWIWKNHDGIREQSEWFDTFGNLLAIIMGLATEKISQHIVSYIQKHQIDKPYPCKSLYPPIRKQDQEWQPYFTKCSAKTPYQYLNAGIWPVLGGFYVAALVKIKKFHEAEKQLEKLSQANKLGKKKEWEFNEWLDGKRGIPKGTPYQGWSAASYIFAHACVKQKKVPFF